MSQIQYMAKYVYGFDSREAFQEFVLATNMSSCQSAEDKLRWAFRMYDKDGSGEK